MTKETKPKPKTPRPSAASQSKVTPEEDKDDSLERSKYIYEQIKGWIENADSDIL